MRLMKSTLALILLLLAGQIFADMPDTYVWKKNVFVIMGDTPPFLIYVTDNMGRITGADPTQPVDSHGIQGDLMGGLQQIPLSTVEQNNGNEDTGFDNTTSWVIRILDANKQTYMVNLKGLAFGTENIHLTVVYHRSTNFVNAQFGVIVQPNVTKQVQVTFDPDKRNIAIQR